MVLNIYFTNSDLKYYLCY